MTRVLIPPLAGVLSALGLGLADVAAMRETAVEAPLTQALLPMLGSTCDGLAEEARAELAQQGVDPSRAAIVRRVHLKYEGTDTALPVPLGPAASMISDFEAAYRQHFSFLMRDRTVVAEAVSVELTSASEHLTELEHASYGERRARGGTSVRMYAGGSWRGAPPGR